MPANHTSTQACASWSVTTQVPSSGVPLVKPTATRAGIPSIRSIAAIAPAKCWQYPAFVWVTNATSGGALPSRRRLVVREAARSAGATTRARARRRTAWRRARRRVAPLVHRAMTSEAPRTTGRRRATARRARARESRMQGTVRPSTSRKRGRGTDTSPVLGPGCAAPDPARSSKRGSSRPRRPELPARRTPPERRNTVPRLAPSRATGVPAAAR